jgi:curved DNA-binding protein CbpA
MSNKDYYAILGVLPSIEPDALRAIYLALIKKYHPDRYNGEKHVGEKISKELNEAYGVLSDPALRAQYDQELKEAKGATSDFFRDEADESDQDLNAESLKSWRYITRYFPDAEKNRLALRQLSTSLASKFQMALIKKKSGSKHEIIFLEMRSEFMHRYFGSNAKIHQFVIIALARGRKDVANEVNNALAVFGSPEGSQKTEEFLQAVRRQKKYEYDDKKNHNRKSNSDIGIQTGYALGTMEILAICLFILIIGYIYR